MEKNSQYKKNFYNANASEVDLKAAGLAAKLSLFFIFCPENKNIPITENADIMKYTNVKKSNKKTII